MSKSGFFIKKPSVRSESRARMLDVQSSQGPTALIPRSSPAKPKAPQRAKNTRPELLFYGRHMCDKLVTLRREDIIRVYCTEETLDLPFMRGLLQWCAQQRKAYHLVSDADLQRITQSVHHEGLAILAVVEPMGGTEELMQLVKGEAKPLLVLDGVQNPHNIGTLMRVMASFGWPALVGAHDLPPLSAAAARMSEGGAAYVRSFACKDLVATLRQLKKLGYTLVGSSSHAQDSLYTHELPKRCALILGSEVNGMSSEVTKLLDREIKIPATGQVESLNVSVAGGLLLGEYCRLHGLGPGS